jgi:putative transposase
VLCQGIPVRYAFIRDHEAQHSVRGMCRVMSVHPSGYYAWRAMPVTPRQRENERLLGLIKQSWLESGGVYGYRKITHDLRDIGERCGKHRFYRLMRNEGLRSQKSSQFSSHEWQNFLWAHHLVVSQSGRCNC